MSIGTCEAGNQLSVRLSSISSHFLNNTLTIIDAAIRLGKIGITNQSNAHYNGNKDDAKVIIIAVVNTKCNNIALDLVN